MSNSRSSIQRLRPLWQSTTVEESPTSIDVDTAITDFDEETFASILEVGNSCPSYFDDFEITVRAADIAEHSIIRLGDGLLKDDRGYEILREFLADESAEVYRWEQFTSELLEDGEIGKLTEYLFDWSQDWSFRLHIDCMIDKSEIGKMLHGEVGSDLPLALSVWSQQQQLERWIESHRADYQQVAATLLPVDQLPVFVFLDDETWESDGILRFYSADQFRATDFSIFESLVSQYLEQMRRDRELIEAGPDLPIVSPTVFDSVERRELFDTVFLYGVFAAVSDHVQRTGGFIEFQTATRRNTLSDQFADEEFAALAESHTSEELTAVYDFYRRFIEKGTRETYRKLWHRSIADECESLGTLAEQAEDVIQTYNFLEEEAIETNFEDLSDAIQDAHTFTADVTSTVSERTTGLTSEIQKVVLTLLGAVFANVFLVIRWANVDMVLPFSIFVIAGILGFYFPTIQTRVNELDDIIKESNADFEVYSNTIQEFSGHLFDFSQFEDRRDSYLEYAQRRKTETVRQLRIIFTLLTVVWLTFVIVSILGFETVSRQFLVAVFSLLPAVLIRHYHADKYYPQTFVPFLERGPSPILTLMCVIPLTVLLKFAL